MLTKSLEIVNKKWPAGDGHREKALILLNKIESGKRLDKKELKLAAGYIRLCLEIMKLFDDRGADDEKFHVYGNALAEKIQNM